VAVRSSARRRNVPVLLVVGALVAASLAGCSSLSGVAAVVDGREISIADLQQATVEVTPYATNATPAGVLMVLVSAGPYEAAAEKAGVAVSATMALDMLTEQAESKSPGATIHFGAGAIEVARFSLIRQNLDKLSDGPAITAATDAEVKKLDVTINPRYGSFGDGTISPAAYPWIVAAAPAG